MTEEDTINSLFNAYAAWRHAKDGLNVRMTPALEKALPKAAEICMSINADPTQFVNAQGKFCKMKEFYPNQLHTYAAVQNYRTYMSRCTSDVQEMFDIQMRYLVDALRTGRKIESVLMDDLIDFRPWFRIVVTEQPNQDIIDTYQEKALNEMTPEVEKFLRQKAMDIKRIKE